jgi:hypothetical protein
MPAGAGETCGAHMRAWAAVQLKHTRGRRPATCAAGPGPRPAPPCAPPGCQHTHRQRCARTCRRARGHLLLHAGHAAVCWRKHELELVVHSKLEADVRDEPHHVGAVATVQRLQRGSAAHARMRGRTHAHHTRCVCVRERESVLQRVGGSGGSSAAAGRRASARAAALACTQWRVFAAALLLRLTRMPPSRCGIRRSASNRPLYCCCGGSALICCTCIRICVVLCVCAHAQAHGVSGGRTHAVCGPSLQGPRRAHRRGSTPATHARHTGTPHSLWPAPAAPLLSWRSRPSRLRTPAGSGSPGCCPSRAPSMARETCSAAAGWACL